MKRTETSLGVHGKPTHSSLVSRSKLDLLLCQDSHRSPLSTMTLLMDGGTCSLPRSFTQFPISPPEGPAHTRGCLNPHFACVPTSTHTPFFPYSQWMGLNEGGYSAAPRPQDLAAADTAVCEDILGRDFRFLEIFCVQCGQGLWEGSMSMSLVLTFKAHECDMFSRET